MSKTNTQVQAAFIQGKAATNSRRSLTSEAQEGFTFLTSYRTTIAIRRAKNEAEIEEVFWDAHSYSPTTSQHQNGHYGTPEFSFGCVAELMGTKWYETAHIMDWGPRVCHDPVCQRERDQQYAMYQAGITPFYDGIFDRCWASEAERLQGPNQHARDLPDYGDRKHWSTSAVLLEFNRGGQRTQVLCGFERGKNIKWSGRTDQLWAAILPMRVYDIQQAFEALKPAYVRNVERHNDLQSEAGQPTVAIRRQGDLYFVACPNGEGPPKDAINLDGVALPPGERANHQPKELRLVMGRPETSPFVAGRQFQANAGEAWTMWARGRVNHPEHPRLSLKSWHRVLPSAAVRGASAFYHNPMGAGGMAGGD